MKSLSKIEINSMKLNSLNGFRQSLKKISDNFYADVLQKCHNEFILFMPFLFLYTLIIFLFKKPYYIGDEPRYLMFAHNILNGFYSPPAPDINLWNGPGYPLLLSFFIKIHLSDLMIVLTNAMWIYLSLVLIYKTLRYFLSCKKAFFWTAVLGFYYPLYRMLPKILTEALTWFLVSLIVFLSFKLYYDKKRPLFNIFFLGFAIFYLMITKVIFGYVVLVLFILLFFWHALVRFNTAKKYVWALFLALMLSVPYLYYTYTLTGKYFYWTNAGSFSLYLMSTPYESEDGRFITPKDLLQSPLHHQEADSILTKMPALQMDDTLKKLALSNIKNHPYKYFKNWLSNIYRLFIAGPFLDETRNIIYTIPNLFITLIIIWSLSGLKKTYKQISFPLYFLLAFFLIYLGGSSLVSAMSRMFFITFPFWTVWVAMIWQFKAKRYDYK